MTQIAFLVHHPALFSHYQKVWEAIPTELFEIVIIDNGQFDWNSEPGARAIRGLLDQEFQVAMEKPIRRRRESHAIVVANHRIKSYVKTTTQPLRMIKAVLRILTRRHSFRGPLDFGKIKVRFMYGADVVDNWSLAAWNSEFDWLLSHGPNDAEALSQYYKEKIFVMGYPRFDGYFARGLSNKSKIGFDLDQTKKTILFMPSYGFGSAGNSIGLFLQLCRKLDLGESYNLIVRPHPMGIDADAVDLDFLQALGAHLDLTPERDTAELFRAADFFIGDYGDSPLAALYLRKRIVLLRNSTFSDSEWLAGSSNKQLDSVFPVIWEDTPADEVSKILSNEGDWENRLVAAESLRSRFYGGEDGLCGPLAGDFLVGLLRGGDPLSHSGGDSRVRHSTFRRPITGYKPVC